LPYHQFIRKINNEELMIKILNEIEQNNSGKILIIGHANVYYYLSDKLTNSRFSIVTNHYLNYGDQKEVIDEIVKNNVKMIIESPTVRQNRELEELSVLNAYTDKNFKLSKEINGYNF
jgi:predicted transcriptional regulator